MKQEYENNQTIKEDSTETIRTQDPLMEQASSVKEKIMDIKRGRGRPRKELKPEEILEENKKLKQQIQTYEAQIGKIKTPFSSGKIHNHTDFYSGNHLKIALISDTHLGSRLERLEDLKESYKIMEKEKVQAVYHSGDLVAGQKVYRGQENEVKVWGYDEQVDYFVQNYPQSKKIKTYFITGNHDLSFLTTTGADIGLRIAQEREDLIYLDQMEADVMIAPKTKLRLWHGGRPAYARSYTQSRYIDGLEGGSKPNILAAGHLHVAFFQDYRNIMAFNVGAFENQTLFFKTVGDYALSLILDPRYSYRQGGIN